MGRWTTTRAVLVGLLLLGAACGDDNDAGSIGTQGTGARDGTEAETGDDAASIGAGGAGGGTDTVSCSLLQPTELEAQFPEVGAVEAGVDAGTPDLDACYWDSADGMSGTFWLGVDPLPPSSSLEDFTGSPEELVPVDGLGDEAYLQQDVYETVGNVVATMIVRTGDTVLSLHAEVLRGESIEEPLTDLAELALGRL